MSTEVAIFEGQGFKVRLIRDEDGRVWFIARDIAEALEYSLEGSITSLFAHVPAIWSARKRIVVRSANGVEQEREMLCLTEQGVYFFLGRSDKPKAIPYQMWIAEKVAPEVRKDKVVPQPRTSLQPFMYKRDKVIRTIIINSEVWFVAKDVCDILGIANARDAISELDDDEKGVAKTDTPGGLQNMAIINEPGLYAMVFKSRKPEAKAFAHWIRHDVVPSIMRTGMYMTPKAKEDLISDPDLIIRLAQEVKEQRAKNTELEAQNKALEVKTGQLESHNHKLEAKIEADKDKVAFAEVVEDCEDGIQIGAFAKILYKKGYVTLGANRLFKWLRDHKILMSGGSQHNYPYQKYMDLGWFKVKEHIVRIGDFERVKTTTLITGKGQRGVLRTLDELYSYRIENSLPLVF